MAVGPRPRTFTLFVVSSAVCFACDDTGEARSGPDAGCTNGSCGAMLETGGFASGGASGGHGTGGTPASSGGSPASGGAKADASADGSPSGATTRDAAIDRSTPNDGHSGFETGTFQGDGSCAAAGVWPPSTPTADSKCVPNCDGTTCGSLCAAVHQHLGPIDQYNGTEHFVGMPCDSGCCASNAGVKWFLAGASSGGGGPAWTGMAESPSGTLYSSAFGGDNSFSSGCSPGVECGTEFAVGESSGLDATSWTTGTTPDLAGTTGLAAFVPQFAFGKAGGKNVAYAVYTTRPIGSYDPATTRVRFGEEVGSSWTFEWLPGSSNPGAVSLAADGSGAPLVLLGDRVLRRRAPGTWDSTCLPDPNAGDGLELAVDQAGAWYVARVGPDHALRVSRRDTDGSWSTETVSAASTFVEPTLLEYGSQPLAIVAVGGTVHVAYSVRRPADAASDILDSVFYARRVGTTWERRFVADPGMRVTSLYMVLDGCGSPHLAAYGASNVAEWSTYYYRWTTAGWRGALVDTNYCDPTESGGLALTATDAYLPFWSCGFWGIDIPLK